MKRKENTTSSALGVGGRPPIALPSTMEDLHAHHGLPWPECISLRQCVGSSHLPLNDGGRSWTYQAPNVQPHHLQALRIRTSFLLFKAGLGLRHGKVFFFFR